MGILLFIFLINLNQSSDFMTKRIIEGAHAVAETVKLCDVKVIASYPITPQIIQ